MTSLKICKINILFSLLALLFIPVCYAQQKEMDANSQDNKTMAENGKKQKNTVISELAVHPVLPPAFKISGYVDAYYAYFSDSVGTNNYQKFPVISPKSNVFGLNIVQLTAQYAAEKVRCIGTLHYGDIPASAWSPVYNMIQEANVGVRLTKKIWLDGGFFKTHIGTEALLPKDNIASSLSIITFYEPWFQAGIKLSYAPNDKWLICLHVLNGYNTYIETNSSKSVGLAISYALGDKGNINYYNLVGDEFPDNTKTKHLRILNNVVFNYQLTPKFKVSLGADYISQQNSNIVDSVINKSSKTAVVYSGILTLKYQFVPKFGIYARGETFSDNDGFLTGTMVDSDLKITGFKLNGATLGVEYKSMDNAYIRLEGRELMMDSKQKIFRTNGTNVNNRTEIMVNMGVWF